MRSLIAMTLVLSACGEPPLVNQPLPPLVAGPPPPRAAAARPGFWRPGERMSWDVRFKGMSVGKAFLSATGDRVRSQFRPDKLFSRGVPGHDLVTDLLPKHDGSHTLHSAMGWLRAWAAPAVEARSLRVEHDGDVYAVDVASPVIDPSRDDWMRVDAQASLPNEAPISVSIWLSRDERRVAERIELSRGTRRVSISLVAYER